MPLFKKKFFPLLEAPADLRPDEQVWQVRYTKEIFRNYEDYLRRIELYRQRVWACKVTGKMHLTYEEALISEHQATQKTLQFPKEFMACVLRLIQFSTLNLSDLLTMIFDRLKDSFVEGEELHGRKDNSDHPCRILKVITGGKDFLYQVGWLDGGKVISTSIEDSKTLHRQKLPFSRGLLKLFIKDSVSLNGPWVVHNKLAVQHGISTELPEDLRENKKLKMSTELEDRKIGENKRANMENGNLVVAKKNKTGMQKEEQPQVEIIKYPIDDLLVKPSPGDPLFPKRPVPSTNFLIPTDNVGDLLMIWDFCSSFGNLLRLSPFSLDELENAIVYDGIANLIVHIHSAILTLLANDNGEFYTLTQERKRPKKVTSENWTDYLCDFLELEVASNWTNDMLKIKQGRYHSLEVHVKFKIFNELVNWATSTDAFRGLLNNYIEQHQSLISAKREEDLEKVRQKREEKQQQKMKASLQENNVLVDHGENRETLNDLNTDVPETNGIHELEKRGSMHEVLASRRLLMKQNLEVKLAMERSKVAEIEKLREEKKVRAHEARERTLKKQREEHFKREIEKLHIRTDMLGKDRDHNRYWFFKREGRFFVESADNKQWGFYASKEELDALMGSLNPKGVREKALKIQLEKHYFGICAALQERSKKIAEKVKDTAVLRRSVRVSVPPKTSEEPPFLRYVNKYRD